MEGWIETVINSHTTMRDVADRAKDMKLEKSSGRRTIEQN